MEPSPRRGRQEHDVIVTITTRPLITVQIQSEELATEHLRDPKVLDSGSSPLGYEVRPAYVDALEYASFRLRL
jgi:hypothetical protein